MTSTSPTEVGGAFQAWCTPEWLSPTLLRCQFSSFAAAYGSRTMTFGRRSLLRAACWPHQNAGSGSGQTIVFDPDSQRHQSVARCFADTHFAWVCWSSALWDEDASRDVLPSRLRVAKRPNQNILLYECWLFPLCDPARLMAQCWGQYATGVATMSEFLITWTGCSRASVRLRRHNRVSIIGLGSHESLLARLITGACTSTFFIVPFAAFAKGQRRSYCGQGRDSSTKVPSLDNMRCTVIGDLPV